MLACVGGVLVGIPLAFTIGFYPRAIDENGKAAPSSRDTAGSRSVFSWSCHAYVPVSELIYAAFRSKAKGLLPPRDECRRLGL
jgi:hypothetical protein